MELTTEVSPLNSHRLPAPDFRGVALDAAARGWRVFPVKPHSTVPAVGEWRKKATTDPEAINRAWDHHPGYNIGMVPCSSGLIVLDLVPARRGEHPPLTHRAPGVHDGADVLAVLTEQAGARLPTETFTVVSPSGGIQMYFTHPADGACPPASTGTDSGLGWHIAIRSADTYVLLPGSTTPDGPYTLAHDAPPAPWPAYLAQRLASGPTSQSCATVTAIPTAQQDPLPVP